MYQHMEVNLDNKKEISREKILSSTLKKEDLIFHARKFSKTSSQKHNGIVSTSTFLIVHSI